MQVVNVDQIEVDDAVWPRHELDHNRVREFISLYEDGGLEALPPLLVATSGERAVLYEGRHRHEALIALGSEQALVQADAVPSGRELVEYAFERALEVSAVSALPLNRAEKRSAAIRLLATRPDYADREIARLTGLSHQTIGRLRERSNGPAATEPDANAGSNYFADTTADELAMRLVRGIRRIWDARGIGDRIVGDRAGKRLATALREQHGEEALAWAERFAAWGRVAVAELKREGAK